MFIRHMFWTMPFPLGVRGTPRGTLWDMDEAGVFMSTANPHHGKAYAGFRVREPGPYTKSEKWTLILAVNCAGERVWEFEKVPGTTAAIFDKFVARVVAKCTPGVQHTFLWDNLSSHGNGNVFNTVTQAGHRVLNRAAYRPEDGPIE
jgi:hypothetical protein